MSEKVITFAVVLELERHIEILLLSNDCVIVPGLGGFMAHHVDARYDEHDGMFLPPLRTLGFNPQLTLNDSLLVQSYIEVYDISYPEALRRIEGEVEELRAHLEADGSYELNGIGVLSFNSEGNLLFTPCEAGILTPGYYGLDAFAFPVEGAEQKTSKQKVASIRSRRDDDTITIKMSWLRNAVAVAAAIIAFLMIASPVGNDSALVDEVMQSSFLPINATHRATPPTVQEEPVNTSETEELIAEEEEVPTAGEGDVSDITTPTTEYSIVMASHVSEHNANLFIGQLSDKGYYDARIWVNRNKVRRVVYGSYASQADAENTLHQLRSESRLFRDTWIIEVKE